MRQPTIAHDIEQSRCRCLLKKFSNWNWKWKVLMSTYFYISPAAVVQWVRARLQCEWYWVRMPVRALSLCLSGVGLFILSISLFHVLPFWTVFWNVGNCVKSKLCKKRLTIKKITFQKELNENAFFKSKRNLFNSKINA